jgi:hypothetical protein
VAQTYFKPENRLVLTIMPRGSSTGGGSGPGRPGGEQ